jgi:hypothetical protein
MRSFLLAVAISVSTGALGQSGVLVTVAPNYVNVPSGATQQFKATVTGTTNTAVTWGACPPGAVDQNGLFTAPTVAKNTSLCVYATSQADPSKTATSYANVLPPTVSVPPCPVESTWSKLQSTEFYNLPAWYLAKTPVPLTWVQPADTVYQSTEFQNTVFNITSWAPSGIGDNIVFQAVNTLGVGDFVKLGGFQLSKFFNAKTVEVGAATSIEFTAYFVGASGASDHGTATEQVPAAMSDKGIWLVSSNSSPDGKPQNYCQWLLAQGGTPPYTYSVTDAPTGLAVNAKTGLYSGVATTPGRWDNIVLRRRRRWR